MGQNIRDYVIKYFNRNDQAKTLESQLLHLAPGGDIFTSGRCKG